MEPTQTLDKKNGPKILLFTCLLSQYEGDFTWGHRQLSKGKKRKKKKRKKRNLSFILRVATFELFITDIYLEQQMIKASKYNERNKHVVCRQETSSGEQEYSTTQVNDTISLTVASAWQTRWTDQQCQVSACMTRMEYTYAFKGNL